VAAIGEGETTVKTGRPARLPLDTFRRFSLRWNRFNALEITRGCAYTCQYKRQLLLV
jgi:hypothetical protein